MRLTCPHCGDRGSEEFLYAGGVPGPRPVADAPLAEWVDHVHLRDNPAGPLDEHWQHVHGCRTWLVVTRDTRDHRVLAVRPARA